MVSSGIVALEGDNIKGKTTGSSKLWEVVEGEKIDHEVVDEVPAAIQGMVKH